MCIRDRASHENQNALPVAKLGLGNPALAPHRRLIDSTINRAGLRNLDGWERQLNLVTASQDDSVDLCPKLMSRIYWTRHYSPPKNFRMRSRPRSSSAIEVA